MELVEGSRLRRLLWEQTQLEEVITLRNQQIENVELENEDDITELEFLVARLKNV